MPILENTKIPMLIDQMIKVCTLNTHFPMIPHSGYPTLVTKILNLFVFLIEQLSICKHIVENIYQ